MIVVSSGTFAQLKQPAANNLLLSLQHKANPWQSFLFKKLTVDLSKPKPFLSPDFYSKQLGFFCKQEIKMDKITKVPFRFRLGSVEQCDWLEGKRAISNWQ